MLEIVLHVLRIIEQRAKLNEREHITLGDIEYAIQELEREIQDDEMLRKAAQNPNFGQG